MAKDRILSCLKPVTVAGVSLQLRSAVAYDAHCLQTQHSRMLLE